MRFYLKYNDTTNIFLGFHAKGYRFVFYTHGKIFSVKDWEKFVKQFKLMIHDEYNNQITWEEFIKFVDYLQYHSNSTWVNNYLMSKDGYNFSNNGGKIMNRVKNE